jgi:diguanylate cyclase (GGDEF)-like protein
MAEPHPHISEHLSSASRAGEPLVGNGSAAVAARLSSALDSRQEHLVKEWLKELIDDLGLESLKSFPTGRLSEGLPALIGLISAYLLEPEAGLSPDAAIDETAACLSSVRRENPSVEKLMRDYGRLKAMILEAATADLRKSDQPVVRAMQLIDEGFQEIVLAGLQRYVEKHSFELQRQADTDPLTGIFNVRYFRRQLHRQLELYKRYRIPFTLIMLDLDELKQLNDTLGHDAGDTALRNMAAILEKEKRETDIAVRYGGDEFFLLLPGTNSLEGERLAYRINRKAKELNLATRGRDMIGVSIGVVSCPDNGTDVSTLRGRADKAMYLAKMLGGGTVARYRDFD